MEAAHATGRRAEILRATVELLSREGPAGVTHRAVAAEAGVPLAATTYYFESKSELLAEALRAMAAEETQRLAEASAMLGGDLEPKAVATSIASVLALQFGRDLQALAKFEVYLEGARREAVRADATVAIEAFRGLAADLFRQLGAPEAEQRARIFVGGIDGLLLHALVTGEGALDTDALSADIEALLRSLLPV